MIQWSHYPKSHAPTELIHAVVHGFEEADSRIGSANPFCAKIQPTQDSRDSGALQAGILVDLGLPRAP